MKCSGQLSYVGARRRIAIVPTTAFAERLLADVRLAAVRDGQHRPYMTADRYQNYRFVLAVLESDAFTPAERRTLADVAEGLLLTRSIYSDEVDDLRMRVSTVLDDLVAGDRMRYGTAVELRARIDECGPDGVALTHA